MSLSLYPNVVNKNLFVSNTAPSYAVPGDQWFNVSTGLLLIFITELLFFRKSKYRNKEA